MLRNRALIPLSHQHQHALALCVRIERGLRYGKANLPSWCQEISRAYEAEISYHFESEQKIIFPAAARHPALVALTEELIAEHERLRSYFQKAAQAELSRDELAEVAALLSAHIRKEERQLFQEMQKLMAVEELERLGLALVNYFSNSGMPGASCDWKRK